MDTRKEFIRTYRYKGVHDLEAGDLRPEAVKQEYFDGQWIEIAPEFLKDVFKNELDSVYACVLINSVSVVKITADGDLLQDFWAYPNSGRDFTEFMAWLALAIKYTESVTYCDSLEDFCDWDGTAYTPPTAVVDPRY